MVAAAGAVAATAQSCVALATSSIGLAIIKQILLGGANKAFNILGNRNSFLSSNLIDAAMPSSLRSFNNMLGKISPNLVEKEKVYIADAAAFTVDLSRPILNNAINNLTADDVARIANGGKSVATQILREKTESQLTAAITPKVSEKLNQFGLVNTLNSALTSTSILSNIFGNTNGNSGVLNNISALASQQMVRGLFNIIEEHENQNRDQLVKAVGTNQL